MRNSEEFEKYVRELCSKKLIRKRERQGKLRKASIILGGCAAACLCAVLALNMRALLDGKSSKDKFAMENSGISGMGPQGEKGENYFPESMALSENNGYVSEAEGNGHMDGTAAPVAEGFSTCAAETGQDMTGSNVVDQHEYGNIQELFTEACDSGIPEAVNVYRNGDTLRVEKQEGVKEIVQVLNVIEIGEAVDVSDDSGLRLELVYSDTTVTYSFTESSVSVSGRGTFSMSSGELDVLERKIDSIAAGSPEPETTSGEAM